MSFFRERKEEAESLGIPVKKLKSTRFPQCTPKGLQQPVPNNDVTLDSSTSSEAMLCEPNGPLDGLTTEPESVDISEAGSVEISPQSDPYDFELNEPAADQIIHKEYSNSFGVKFKVGDIMVLGKTAKTFELVQIQEILETGRTVSALYMERRKDRTVAPFQKQYKDPISLMFNHLLFRCSRKDYLSMEEENDIKDKLSDIFD